MMSKTKTIISLIVNLLIFVITVVVFISYFFTEPNILIKTGWESLKYFTTDSNLLVAAASLVVAICEIRMLKGDIKTLPRAAVMFKFIGSACVMMTFGATMLFLMPHYGTMVISGGLFIVHVSTPLMAVLSLMLLETVHRIRIPELFIPLIPMFLYGAVYYVMVKVLGEAHGGWKDFYAYDRGGQYIWSLIFMTLGCVVAAVLTGVLHNLLVKHAEKKLKKAEA